MHSCKTTELDQNYWTFSAYIWNCIPVPLQYLCQGSMPMFLQCKSLNLSLISLPFNRALQGLSQTTILFFNLEPKHTRQKSQSSFLLCLLDAMGCCLCCLATSGPSPPPFFFTCCVATSRLDKRCYCILKPNLKHTAAPATVRLLFPFCLLCPSSPTKWHILC